MSETVADVLVSALHQVGVKQIFALIGDSLNPLADAVRRSSIEWIGVRHEEGAALAASGQAKLTGHLAVCAGTTGPGSISSPASMRPAATMLRFWRCRGTCRVSSREQTIIRLPRPTCCFAMLRSTPRRSLHPARRPR
jgi:Thiamine pyrophosphate enzyme, N-terminal TPP binding domain